jgi:two-component system, LytTR family, response regulator
LKQTIRTLIVDDEPLARDAIRILLQDDADIEIISDCSNGVEAVKMILKYAPDLVFLDVQMPDLDGFQVIEQVGRRQDARHRICNSLRSVCASGFHRPRSGLYFEAV